MPRKIVLASSSPRRKALLHQIGLAFEVDPSGDEEEIARSPGWHELAREMSRRKALAVAPRHPKAIIIAADTFGVLDGKLIGKPASPLGAKEMLRSLSGRSHLVITGFTVLDTASGGAESRSVETAVHFRELTDAEIEAYVATGEPLDKAGAYAIQGLGAMFVDRIEGDYYNVIGLPLCPLAEVLRGFGVEVL